MTRKPVFWIVLALLGIAGSVLSFRLFPVAFPILSVNIEMDREGALDQARELATRFGWEPDVFRQAASFGHLDSAFQMYMELEGGGLEEIHRLDQEGIFSLYAWRVRHFSEGTVEEAEVRFTPQGDPYGFRLRLSEEAQGENLSTEEARELALAQASENWGMEPSLYELLESSQEEQPGGRIDHTFVYERSDETLEEARIRLRVRVGGDRLTELMPFSHVPDAFLRRYQDTRNANESISLAGTIIFLLLFLVIGGGVGTVHLLKKRWVEWKTPLAWGALVAGLMALGQLNSLPLSWMAYNTALPSQVHVATLVLTSGLTFVVGAVFLALLFMTGEGLLRLGFPNQIQQWKIWAPGVANSDPVLGRTAAPYLVLGLKLGMVVAFYLATSRLLGWWSPASALAQPDLLATYFPWLTAVSTSLFAAFSEETIFRAIPIGAAAILGRRYGKPGLWIWGAVILQAVVFGASHANYPQQPAYARVVEIFPTYLAWGVVCVYFGLIPSIIGHFIYDLVLFSLPLFAAETSGIWVDRFMVIGAGLLPLAIVFIARWRKGRARTAPEWALNRSWRPPAKAGTEDTAPAVDAAPMPPETIGGESLDFEPSEPDSTEAIRPTLSPLAKAALGAVGLVGLVLWISGLETGDSPRITRTRPQVEAEARAALEAGGADLGPDWMPLFSINSQKGLSHQFVWRQGTEDDYGGLSGTFLSSPGWRVRFVNFQAAPEERAESYTVSFSEGGGSPRIRHDIPEGRPGETLSEEEARSLAHEALESGFGSSSEVVREISGEESVRPGRTDWTFTFAATDGYPLPEGEARLQVRIAGAEVVETRRFVHIPESWERDWRAQESKRGLLSALTASILLLLALGAAILAIVRWTQGSLLQPPLRILTMAMAIPLLGSGINEWPNALAAFSTQTSFSNQAVMILLGIGLSLAFLATSVGLLGALGHTWIQRRSLSIEGSVGAGMALGAAYVGLSALLSRMTSTGPPGWPDFGGAVTFVPWLSPAFGAPVGFLIATAAALLLLGALERTRGTRWAWTGVPLALLAGLTLAPNPPGAGWAIWLGAGVGLSVGVGILWILCRRLGWAILPGVMATPILLNLVTTGVQHPYPGHALGAVLGVAAVLTATGFWARAL